MVISGQTAKQIGNDGELDYKWEPTVDAAINLALNADGFVAIFGKKINLQTTIEELAVISDSINAATAVLAKREEISPDHEVLRRNTIKDYYDFIEKCRKKPNTPEYNVAEVFDAVNDGRKPTLNEFKTSLVEQKVLGYNNNDPKKPDIGFTIKNWRSLVSNIGRLIEGYNLAYKIGELKKGESQIEKLIRQKNTKSNKQTEQNKIQEPLTDGLSLIYPNLRKEVINIENQIKEKIEKWQEYKDLIGCAAFCQVLFEKNYFFPETKHRRVADLEKFVKERYGVIKNKQGLSIVPSLGKINDKNNANAQYHKSQFYKYFN